MKKGGHAALCDAPFGPYRQWGLSPLVWEVRDGTGNCHDLWISISRLAGLLQDEMDQVQHDVGDPFGVLFHPHSPDFSHRPALCDSLLDGREGNRSEEHTSE